MFLFRYFILVLVFAAQILHVQAQLQNLALHRAAIQSTTHTDYIANMSVDGIITQTFGVCSHTNWPNTFAWWQVDLNKTYGIQSIKIYHRDGVSYRLNGFKITINTRNEWQNVQPCYSDTVNGTQPSIVTVVTCKGPARYVRIYNEKSGDQHGPILNLCEVQVFGCAQNRYGDDCKLDCNCKQRGCFFENGTCFVPGCKAGWHGKSCNKSCDANKFGPDCNFTCHCHTGTCNRSTGVCDEIGCKAGWKGDNCSIQCNSIQNEFGVDCNSTCYCLIGSCNVTNGVCNTPGCNAGWKGDTCSTQCEKAQNEFGFDCNSTCQCNVGSCNLTTGVCNTPGCKIGWIGNSCSTLCMNNTFGVECNNTCHCKQSSCENTDGHCFKPGCKPGWKGNNCSIPCDKTKNEFEFDCNSICHCSVESCNVTTGVCNTPGCKAGWKGDTCSAPCMNNTFGVECNNTCHCKEGSCDNTDGQCFKPGCKPGWKGNNCSIPCDKGFFGSYCSTKCYCKSDTCDRISGKCKDEMCKNGWTGETCSKKCENGTFGYECATECHCLIGACHNEHGACHLRGCKGGWKGTTCSERIPEEMDTSLLVGVSVGGLGLIFMAVLITVCICRRRRSGKDKNNVVISEAKPDVALDHVYDELGFPENTDYSVIETGGTIETTYVNGASASTVLSMDNISGDVGEMIKNGILQTQHKNIPFGALYPQTVGNLMKNKKKNRNQNVLPYDNSRVILDTTDQSQDNNYINASYINSVTEDLMYIATQGPMENTVEDFWKMVWQTKSSVIVMLTNKTEDKKVTCFQYWPESSNALAFREYEVILLKERTTSEFISRKLKVKNLKTGEVRNVWQLQFTSWPRQGVPNPYQLLLLHQKYTEIMSTKPSGPAIIHCSDGSDRSGVFIAFDAMVKCCYRNEAIDICKLVTEMRKKRMNMVTTEESYILVHKLFLESLQFQGTHITRHDFCAFLQEGDNIQEREYEMLVNNLPEYDDAFYKEAMLKKNRGKHRNRCILPVETYRITLNKTGAAHYVNAVGVPSCRMSKQFLVTQIPFANTVVDLWKMMFEYNSRTIVNLEEAPSFEKDLIWHPIDENKLVLGQFILGKTSDSMTTRGTKEISLKVLQKETKNDKLVKVFRYLNWRPCNVTPSPQTSFLDFIHLVYTWNKSINNGPITVICSDGAKCCGLFCLVYSVIENLSYSDDINIFQIARLQQIRRPQFFSVEQYHFCYNIVQEYLEKIQLYNDIE